MPGIGPARFEDRVRSAPPKSLEPVGAGKSGALLGTWADGMKAIVKLAKEALPSGKSAQRGIPAREHPRRELAFYRLACAMGWADVVPKVVLFDVDGEEASAQAFVPAAKLSEVDPRLDRRSNPGWVKGLRCVASLVPKTQWLKLVLLDVVAGSRDRHSNNVGIRVLFDGDAATYGLVAWDNAVSFGKTFRLYHEVFHKYLFRDKAILDPAWARFCSLDRARLARALEGLISPAEVEHAWLRHQFVVDFPYKVPWRKMSGGEDDSSKFPDYRDFFKQRLREVGEVDDGAQLVVAG